jgi:hypothetical protein
MVRNTKKIDLEQVLGIDIVQYVVDLVNHEKISLWDAADRINEMLAPHNRSVSSQSIWNYCNHAGYSPRTVMVKDDFVLETKPTWTLSPDGTISDGPDRPGVPPV